MSQHDPMAVVEQDHRINSSTANEYEMDLVLTLHGLYPFYDHKLRVESMTVRSPQLRPTVNESSNSENTGCDRKEMFLALHSHRLSSNDKDLPMFPPRSSSFQNAEKRRVHDDASTASQHSPRVYSMKMRENETSGTQSPHQEGSESRDYQRSQHSGADTPAPFAEITEIHEEATFLRGPSSFEATEPRPSSPPIAFISESRRLICPLDSVNSTLDTLFVIAKNMTHQQRASLNFGPHLDIRNSETGETYVQNVPQRMLYHFCVYSTIERRFKLSTDESPDILYIAPSEAEKSAVVRVIRYMRRWSSSCGAAPTGQLRIPPSIRSGIETIRACRLFGLHADANRIEDLLVETLMGGGNWKMTDEHVELIWNDYGGSVRDTALGDAIVWFVLPEVQSEAHPLADEIKWMMEQEEYTSLKEKVKEENMRKIWRWEGRSVFLERCKSEREKLRRRQREKRKYAREVEKRAKATRKARQEARERESVASENVAGRVSRPEAPQLESRLQTEQNSNRNPSRNVVSTTRITETSITATSNSSRAEERKHPVRRVPSTETQLSDLWNNQPDSSHYNNKTSISSTKKPLLRVPMAGHKNDRNHGSRHTGSSQQNANLPQLTSFRIYRPDIPHPYDYRAAGRSDSVSSERHSRANTTEMPRPSVPAISDMKATHSKSGGFWRKILTGNG